LVFSFGFGFSFGFSFGFGFGFGFGFLFFYFLPLFLTFSCAGRLCRILRGPASTVWLDCRGRARVVLVLMLVRVVARVLVVVVLVVEMQSESCPSPRQNGMKFCIVVVSVMRIIIIIIIIIIILIICYYFLPSHASKFGNVANSRLIPFQSQPSVPQPSSSVLPCIVSNTHVHADNVINIDRPHAQDQTSMLSSQVAAD
jgi:hypothetical protein